MPNQDIIIKVSSQETSLALIYNGLVQEIYIERNFSKGLVGNIFIGKVVRVLPGMQSAFIDIGVDKTAFLHVGDMYQAQTSQYNNLTPIEKILLAGQYILVQVIKDPINNKGARLSTFISLVGRNLVYLPTEKNQIGISQKITDNQERDMLRQKLESILPINLKGGLILRTASGSASSEDFMQDIKYLTHTWHKISQIYKTEIKQVYQELPLAFKICRDSKKIDAIHIDDIKIYTELKEFIQLYLPNMHSIVHLHQEANDIFSLYNIEHEIQKILQSKVELKSGGFLIIEQTQAMVTIDVNTGAYIGKTSFADTVLKINLEATYVIAQQLRLRNLGGIIILDFIDMHQEGHQEIILQALKQALSFDRVKTHVYGFTQLGLVEMTRKRTRDSLSHILCSICDKCYGTGFSKTLQTLCYEVMHEIERQSKQFNPKAFKIIAHTNIIQQFLEQEKIYFEALMKKIDKPIYLQSQSFSDTDMYDIILLNE